MENYFSDRLNQLNQLLQEAKKKSNIYSIIRVILFVLIIGLLMVFFSINDTNDWWLLIVVLLTLGFYQTVILHIQWLEKITYYKALIKLNNDELQRLQLVFSDLPTGIEFQQKDHPYHIDLDIFGPHSLFQLVNRCELPESRTLLANWLSEKASTTDINKRQESIRELSKMPEWIQSLQAVAHIEVNKKQKSIPHVTQQFIIDWVRQPTTFKVSIWWKTGTILLTGISFILASLSFLQVVPYQVLYLLLLTNVPWLIISVRNLQSISKGIDQSNYLIGAFLETLSMVEHKDFTSEPLKELQHQLTSENGKSAKSEIQLLKKLTHRLAARSNVFYLLADGLFLLDAYLLTDLCHWKARNKDHLEAWFLVINEIECLSSLAGFSFAQPDYVFPVVDEQPFHFEAKDMGHPLILPAEKICNDYQIKGKGHIDVITGSNMSGKSTFERTLGINMVLAQMGAPVNATSLTMCSTNVFASMRTNDDLAKHTSSFYAELKRIRQLLDYADQQEATFFVLDELLKGTNSDDRHKGAVALIRQLIKKPVFGIISTHDLALGKEMVSHQHIRNFSFNSEIVGDRIVFDYRLTPGLCKSFNASQLMEQMGIIEK